MAIRGMAFKAVEFISPSEKAGVSTPARLGLWAVCSGSLFFSFIFYLCFSEQSSVSVDNLKEFILKARAAPSLRQKV